MWHSSWSASLGSGRHSSQGCCTDKMEGGEQCCQLSGGGPCMYLNKQTLSLSIVMSIKIAHRCCYQLFFPKRTTKMQQPRPFRPLPLPAAPSAPDPKWVLVHVYPDSPLEQRKGKEYQKHFQKQWHSGLLFVLALLARVLLPTSHAGNKLQDTGTCCFFARVMLLREI